MIESWGKHKEWDGTGAVPYNNTFWIAAQPCPCMVLSREPCRDDDYDPI